ncbi:MAG: alpha/beta fold hydrolase [Hyphomicrobiales bacterium]
MEFRELRYGSADGLSLYAREYGPAAGGPVPLLCLPGLTRNSRDFETIAARLAAGRRIVCPDFRGRGRSQYAADPLTYRPEVELADTIALLDWLGIARAAVIGTSRGGIVAMVMAAKHPERLAGILFNDIGPKIETEGLLRIRSYLGQTPCFASWADAVAGLRAVHAGFETLSDAEWLAFARRVFRDESGVLRPDSDPGIAAAFPTTEDIETGKVPELWPLFELTAAVPVTVLRGANSDLLSEETVAGMMARHGAAEAVTVRNRGHVPFLDEPEAFAAIERWLDRVDRQAQLVCPGR